jgi:hypothetical protein
MRLATWSSMMVPLVARAVGRPTPVASSARSNTSGRISGSPPEKTRIGRPVSGRERIISAACPVFRSSRLIAWATSSRRQCTQARLQAAVVSQHNRRNPGAAAADGCG